LGSGAYGHVWKVKSKMDNKTYAIKKVFLAFQNEIDAQRIYREIAILSKVKHENIVLLKEILPAKNNMDIYLVF
jgi:serine/threonine protein kinase